MRQEKLSRMWEDLRCCSQGVIRGLDESDIILDGSDKGKEQKKAVKRNQLQGRVGCNLSGHHH